MPALGVGSLGPSAAHISAMNKNPMASAGDAAAVPSVRLSGHELLSEGAPFVKEGRHSHLARSSYGTGGTGRGKCSCGALSEVLDSGTKRKAWHRGHKDEIRGAGRAD